MRKVMRKVLACTAMLAIALSMLGCALAAEYPSKGFKLPTVKARPTAAPETPDEEAESTEAPDAEPTEAPETEPTEQPEETPDDNPEQEPKPITGTAVVTLKYETSALNVRAEADKDSKAVASLKHGDVVSVYGIEGDWAHILTADGVEGYVVAAYLQEELPEVEPTEEPEVEPTEAPEVDPTEEPEVEPTEEPEVEPTEEPEVEPTEEPEAEPTEEPEAEPTEEPEAEPTKEPLIEVLEPVEPLYTYERDENGALVLDENGNPIAIVPEGMEVPVTYMRDEEGNLILDENGDPIVKDTVPADAEIITTLKDRLNPERYIDVYVATDKKSPVFGQEATLVAVLYGYDNAIYTLQWQNSKDGETWTDIPGATDTRCTVTVTEENYLDYWQIEVTITGVLESTSEAA